MDFQSHTTVTFWQAALPLLLQRGKYSLWTNSNIHLRLKLEIILFFVCFSTNQHEHVKPCFSSLRYLPVETCSKFRYLMLSILTVMILKLAQCAAAVGHSLFKPAICVPQVFSDKVFTQINNWCYLTGNWCWSTVPFAPLQTFPCLVCFKLHNAI